MERPPLRRNLDHELLATYLTDRDVACPTCRYNLRGVQGDRCPECGTTLMLQVGQAQVRYGAYLVLFALLATPAMNFFFALPWTIRIIVDMFETGTMFRVPLYFWIMRVGGLVAIPLFILTWVNRQKLIATRYSTQWCLVIGPAVYQAVILGIVVFDMLGLM